MLFEGHKRFLYYSLERWPELTVKVPPTRSYQNIPLLSRTPGSSQCRRGILGSPVPPGLKCQGGKSVCNIWCIPRTARVSKKLVPQLPWKHGSQRCTKLERTVCGIGGSGRNLFHQRLRGFETQRNSSTSLIRRHVFLGPILTFLELECI